MRVHRADPLLNEAIEALDLRLAHAKKTLPKATAEEHVAYAWTLLTPLEIDFIMEEVGKIADSRVYYLNNYHVIQTEQGILTCLHPLYSHQEMVEEALTKLFQEEGQARVIIDKPRQSGITEYCNGVICWRTFPVPHAYTMSVAQAPDVAAHIQRKMMISYQHLPWWIRPELRYITKGEFLEFGRKDMATGMTDPGLGSVMVTTHAQRTSGAAIGRTVRTLHGCLTENNKIIDSTGMAVSIANALCESSVVDGTGKPAKVTAFSKRMAKDIYPGAENGYLISPWCSPGLPLEGTGNHKVLACDIRTERRRVGGRNTGVRKLGILKMTQFSKLCAKTTGIAIPVLPITDDGTVPAPIHKTRPQGGGITSIWEPPIKPDREFGYAVGLYLAEGNATGRRLVITLDSDEQYLADRFARAVGVEYKKRSSKKARTTWYLFEKAALRDWFALHVGHLETKRIAPWMWQLGKDFLIGVVEGLILGDGHISPRAHSIVLSTTRAQLAISLRWIVAALGMGWASIRYRKAGLYYGRDCAETWTVSFCQKTNAKLRSVLNLPECANIKQKDVSHWMYTDDNKYIVCPIRSIKRIPLGYVYDIEVQNDDHTYLLPSALTHNSEVSRWLSGEVYSSDIEPSMNALDTLAFMESTGYGEGNFFHNLWLEAVEGDSDWTAVFLPAYRAKKYSLPLKPNQLPFELTDAEKAVNERVLCEEGFQITNEFWNWRRRRIKAAIKRTGYPYAHYESYPISWQESFQSSGTGAFPRHKLDEQQQANVRKPLWVGEIAYQGKGAAPKVLLNYMLDSTGQYLDIALEKRELTNRLYLWEQPDPRESYYVAADVGGGVVGNDFSVVEVMRAGAGSAPDVQVGEWVGYEPPLAFAKIIYALGWWFNKAEVAVEYAREGMITANSIFNDLEYPNLYRPRREDRTGNQFAQYLHWQTTSKTKPLMMGRLIETLLEDGVVLQSQYVLDELRKCVRSGSAFEALGGHDDAAVTICIALYCLRQTMPELRQQWDREGMGAVDGSAATPVRSARASGGAAVYGLYDEFFRLRGQSRDLQKAEAEAARHPGWQVKSIPVSKANTAYSIVHHGGGLEHELYVQGIRSQDITPAVVTRYAEITNRLAQGGVLPQYRRPGQVEGPSPMAQLSARVTAGQGDAEWLNSMMSGMEGDTL